MPTSAMRSGNSSLLTYAWVNSRSRALVSGASTTTRLPSTRTIRRSKVNMPLAFQGGVARPSLRDGSTSVPMAQIQRWVLGRWTMMSSPGWRSRTWDRVKLRAPTGT